MIMTATTITTKSANMSTIITSMATTATMGMRSRTRTRWRSWINCGEAKDALSAGDVKKADKAVHKIGHVLEELPELAAKETELAGDDTIKPAIDDLFDCFDRIDRKLHEDAGKTYDEVADRIDAAMKTFALESQERGEVSRENDCDARDANAGPVASDGRTFYGATGWLRRHGRSAHRRPTEAAGAGRRAGRRNVDRRCAERTWRLSPR